MTPSSGIAIIGAGVAAYSLAAELVTLGYTSPVTIVGDEPEGLYDRTALSKGFLDSGDEEGVRLTPLPSERVSVCAGDPVADVDVEARILHTRSGRTLGWRQLVFATGALPIRLPGFHPDGERLHVLRTLEDARRIRTSFAHARSVALVGAGPIGLELAAFARTQGCQVTVLDAAERIMSRCLPPVISDRLLRFHTEQGVDIRLRQVIRSVSENGVVELEHDSVRADVIVLGIGVRANDDLAGRSGVVVHDGILVDEWLRSSIPEVYAIGDVARFHNPHSGLHERRETWWNARDQGLALARIIVDPEAAEPFDAIPWFWSDQGGMYVQAVGATRGEQQTTRGDFNAGRFSVLQWDADRLVGASSVNAPREFKVLKRLVDARARLDPEQASRADVDLTQLAQSGART